MDTHLATEISYKNGYKAGYKAALVEIEKLIRDTIPNIYDSDEVLTALYELKIKGE